MYRMLVDLTKKSCVEDKMRIDIMQDHAYSEYCVNYDSQHYAIYWQSMIFITVRLLFVPLCNYVANI